MFALVDCNNFYASCERVFRPDLNGKPVVVLSNNDGCVIARSNEAKDVGVPMGAPAFEYEDFFKENKVHVFSANFSLYGNMSQRVMDILETYCPEIEVYSIDEAFLHFQGYELLDLPNYASQIQKSVSKGTGIPICIGFAPTKALAKVANRIAKKYPQKTGNVYLIDTEEKRIKALKWLKIGDVWGIGRRHAKRLLALNVKTAYDFTQLDDSWVRKHMAVVGLRLKHDLQGIPTLNLDEFQEKRNISTTRTFEKNYKTRHEVAERVASFTVICAEKLRLQKSCCNEMMVFLQTNRYHENLAQYRKSIVITLPFPTNSSLELVKFAAQALDKIFIEGYEYKRAGVILMNFSPEDQKQLKLFENSEEKHQVLMKTIDRMNLGFGEQKIKIASQDLKRTWKMKQERLSPSYTTKFQDIITIRV